MTEESQQPPGVSPRGPTNNLTWAMYETAKVETRIDEALGSHVDVLYLVLGMIPNATRRIITEISEQTAQDHCALYHASRLFTNAMSAYLLTRKGLIADATVVARTALETMAQGILLLRDPAAAISWLNGRNLSAGQVRKRLNDDPDVAPLYRELSNLSHSTPVAVIHNNVMLPGRGEAILFGGAYRPKTAARLAWVSTIIALEYLHAFYDRYRQSLSLDQWPMTLELGAAMCDGLHQWLASLPEDVDDLRTALSQRPEEERMPPPVVSSEDSLKMAEAIRQARLSAAEPEINAE